MASICLLMASPNWLYNHAEKSESGQERGHELGLVAESTYTRSVDYTGRTRLRPETQAVALQVIASWTQIVNLPRSGYMAFAMAGCLCSRSAFGQFS